MKIDFSDITEEDKDPIILDEWGYDGSPPYWWDKVIPEFRALYNDFGPMVLITHKLRRYLISNQPIES